MASKKTTLEEALKVLKEAGYKLPELKEEALSEQEDLPEIPETKQESLDLTEFNAGEDKSEDVDLGDSKSAGQLEYINSAHYGMRIKLDPKYRRSHARLSGNTMFPASMYAAEIMMDKLDDIDPDNKFTLDELWLDIFLEMTQSINGEGLKHDVELLKASYRPDFGGENTGDIFKGG